jgi:hypothetical protein
MKKQITFCKEGNTLSLDLWRHLKYKKLVIKLECNTFYKFRLITLDTKLEWNWNDLCTNWSAFIKYKNISYQIRVQLEFRSAPNTKLKCN